MQAPIDNASLDQSRANWLSECRTQPRFDRIKNITAPPGKIALRGGSRLVVAASDEILVESIALRFQVLADVGKAYWPRYGSPTRYCDPNRHRHAAPDHISTEQLMAQLDGALRLPGLSNAWTMPVKGRIDMLTTGIRTPVGLKISGDDTAEIEQIGTLAWQYLEEFSYTEFIAGMTV